MDAFDDGTNNADDDLDLDRLNQRNQYHQDSSSRNQSSHPAASVDACELAELRLAIAKALPPGHIGDKSKSNTASIMSTCSNSTRLDRSTEEAMLAAQLENALREVEPRTQDEYRTYTPALRADLRLRELNWLTLIL